MSCAFDRRPPGLYGQNQRDAACSEPRTVPSSFGPTLAIFAILVTVLKTQHFAEIGAAPPPTYQHSLSCILAWQIAVAAARSRSEAQSDWAIIPV